MDTETAKTFLVFAIGLIFVTIGFVALWLSRARSKKILNQWAERNEIELLSSEQGFLAFGPFKWWTTSRNQTIFHLRVRDRDGLERSAWARCGSHFGGVFFSDEIEIQWDGK